MIGIREVSNNVIHNLFPDGTDAEITATGFVGPFINRSFKTPDFELVDIPGTEPDDFFGGLFVFDGQWSVIDQGMFDLKVQQKATKLADKLSKAKAAKAQQIVADFESAVAQITAGYTQAERDSFGKQEQQALAFNANPDETRIDLKMLKNMATQRNKTMQQVADRILLKADAFERAFGDLLGIKQAREDALAALGDGATLADVVAI